jgi:hypothetical protein
MSEPSGDAVVRGEIARRAYARFCDRGCVHGGDVDDWLAAERDVLAEQATSRTQESPQPATPVRRNRKPRR